MTLSSSVLGAGSDTFGDVGDFAEFAGRDRDDQVVGLVVGQGQPAAVQPQEGDQGAEREALVAIDQRVVAGDRLRQSGGLLLERRVCILAEDRRLRTGGGRLE